MTSEAPFLHCRLCGLRFRSDQVTHHEIQCSQQQNPNAGGNEAPNRNSRTTLPNLKEGVNEIRDRPGSYAAPAGGNKTRSPSDSKPLTTPQRQNYTGEATKNDHQPANSDSHRVDPNEVHVIPESNDYHEPPRDVDAFRGSREETEFQSNKESNSKDINRDDDKKMMESNPYPSSSNAKLEEESPTAQENQQQSLDSTREEASNGADDDGLAELLKDQRKLSDQQVAFKKRRDTMGITPSPSNSKQNHLVPHQSSSAETSHEEFLANLPEPSPEAETAYWQHRKSLVPCTHCKRKFVPDRLTVHERSCIRRPKTREYITPDKKSSK